MAASGALTDLTGRSAAEPAPAPPGMPSATPNPPNITFASERFMARVMMRVRMSPDAPTSEPAMISSALSKSNGAPSGAEDTSAKPVAAAAMPEYELRRAMTTGMSAPPIGMTTSTPPISATAASASSISSICGLITSTTAIASAANNNSPLMTWRTGISTGCVATMP